MSTLELDANSVCNSPSVQFFVCNARVLVDAKQAPPPMCLPSVYLMSSQVTRSPWPSPSILAYCKQSNAGSWNGLGTRLAKSTSFLVYCSRHASSIICPRFIQCVLWKVNFNKCVYTSHVCDNCPLRVKVAYIWQNSELQFVLINRTFL